LVLSWPYHGYNITKFHTITNCSTALNWAQSKIMTPAPHQCGRLYILVSPSVCYRMYAGHIGYPIRIQLRLAYLGTYI
jgi:hypothetical protein